MASPQVLGTPTLEEIQAMNQNYTEYKFPQVKPHPWNKVFRPRTPSEAIELVSKFLRYAPDTRLKPLEGCAMPFFDELRDQNLALPNGRAPPPLFDFKPQGDPHGAPHFDLSLRPYCRSLSPCPCEVRPTRLHPHGDAPASSVAASWSPARRVQLFTFVCAAARLRRTV